MATRLLEDHPEESGGRGILGTLGSLRTHFNNGSLPGFILFLTEIGFGWARKLAWFFFTFSLIFAFPLLQITGEPPVNPEGGI